MKISASIYSNDNKKPIDLVRELDLFKIDYIHIDCNDDISVFHDIREIRKISKTPIDLHIISDKPEIFFPFISELKIELVTFQYEYLLKPFVLPKNMDSKIGIAIMTETENNIFEEYKNIASFILFMTTTPGKSGGVFDSRNFTKIKNFKKQYPNKKIHVDGGVNEEVSFILRNLGVYCSVSGSYLVKSNTMGASLLTLKSDLDNVNYSIKDFMLQNNEISIINKNELTFKNLLERINQYKLGFCIIVNDKKLYGIVTDGDIRRILLKHIEDLNNVDVLDMINYNPIIINENKSIMNMLNKIKEYETPITFIPVVNNNKELRGAISFNNLAKGEL